MDKKVNDVDPNTHTLELMCPCLGIKAGLGEDGISAKASSRKLWLKTLGLCVLWTVGRIFWLISMLVNSCNVSSSVDVRLNLLGRMGCSFYEVILRCGIVSCLHSTHLAQGQWW